MPGRNLYVGNQMSPEVRGLNSRGRGLCSDQQCASHRCVSLGKFVSFSK